jgi:hypothetical protein
LSPKKEKISMDVTESVENDGFVKPTAKSRKRKAKEISSSAMDTETSESTSKRPTFPELSAEKLTVSENMTHSRFYLLKY